MSIAQLDAIVRCADKLREGVDALDITHLRALADRLDLDADSRDYDQLRPKVKRALLGVGVDQRWEARKNA